MAKVDSNLSKGKDSYDVEMGGVVVPFFNKNIMPYATEAGGFKFDLVPVEKQKDIMLNVARMHAQQEYDRIMELVAVLQKQANSIKRRLEVTDLVHSATYDYQLSHGQTYWVVYDHRKKQTLLLGTGPTQWSSGQCPNKDWEYLCAVKWLGDNTWIETDNDGNPVV
jgi:hypothetical protein